MRPNMHDSARFSSDRVGLGGPNLARRRPRTPQTLASLLMARAELRELKKGLLG